MVFRTYINVFEGVRLYHFVLSNGIIQNVVHCEVEKIMTKIRGNPYFQNNNH